jgi:hypothetical protein
MFEERVYPETSKEEGMHELFLSPYVVPVVAILAGIAWIGFTSWRKVREQELNSDREMRLKEMEHEQKMKEIDLQLARLKDKP